MKKDSIIFVLVFTLLIFAGFETGYCEEKTANYIKFEANGKHYMIEGSDKWDALGKIGLIHRQDRRQKVYISGVLLDENDRYIKKVFFELYMPDKTGTYTEKNNRAINQKIIINFHFYSDGTLFKTSTQFYPLGDKNQGEIYLKLEDRGSFYKGQFNAKIHQYEKKKVTQKNFVIIKNGEFQVRKQ